jgi:RNA polymerase sigma-70 factor, ECF subfamily
VADLTTPTLEDIWAEFATTLRQFIRSRVAGAETAEDILQDVFVKIQRQLNQLKAPVKLRGWLYLIARNAIIDHYRTTRKTMEVPESLPIEPPEDDAEMDELKAALRPMVHNLAEPYRQALVLTEFEGLTQKELAERLGMSFSGAKSRVQRGREQLRQMLLDCCHFEFDRRGNVIHCTPRTKECCR